MEIADIKKQLSITAVLAHYNIKIQRGKQIHCPFHLAPAFVGVA